MSALECTDLHIAYLVLARTRQLRALSVTVFSEDEQSLARMLKYENRRSVAERYRERAPIRSWVTAQDKCPSCGAERGICDPMQFWRKGDPKPCPFAGVTEADFEASKRIDRRPEWVIKQAQFYRHQSDEHEGWKTSLACEVTESIIASAISDLDAWKEAPWGL